MAIIQTVIKGSGGAPTIPNYIAPKNNVNGVYKPDNTATSFTLNGATSVDEYALYRAFYACTGLTSVGLSSLTTISSTNAMDSCFYGCTGLTSVDLGLLTTLSGNYALTCAFQNCTGLTSVDLSSLTTITGSSAINKCFYGCTGLTTIDLSSLTTITGSSAMTQCFYGCKGLTTVTIGGTTPIDFGTNKNCFTNIFANCNQASGIDLYIATDQATLSQFTGYPSFGATCDVRIHYTAE